MFMGKLVGEERKWNNAPGIKEVNSNTWRYFLYALLVIGLLVRLHGILVLKKSLSHDESVSYLCAAATEGKFELGLPEQVNIPLFAADIHAYYAQPGSLQFVTVAKDLALYDIHPPLYFWTLHAIHFANGMDIRNGPLLNLALTLLLLVLLYRTALEILGEPLHALSCCTIWFLSPAVVSIDLEARHYQLFALLALTMFALGRQFWSGKASSRTWVLFTMINAMGFLTHYYYGLFLVPGIGFMLVRFGFRRNTWLYGLSLLGSLALFLLLFPAFWDFLANYMADREIASGKPVQFMPRAKALIATSFGFFSWWRSVTLLIVFTGIVTVFRWARGEKHHRTQHVGSPFLIWGSYIHIVWYFTISSFLYLLGISPFHAVGGEYFGMIWPLFCIALVHGAVVALEPAYRKLIFAAFAVQLMASCFLTVRHSPYVIDLVPATWYQSMNESDVVITNEGRRGYLPRMAWGLRSDMPIWVLSGAGMERFDATSSNTIAFWLYVPDLSAPAQPALQRMRDIGSKEESRIMGNHQLHLFQQ